MLSPTKITSGDSRGYLSLNLKRNLNVSPYVVGMCVCVCVYGNGYVKIKYYVCVCVCDVPRIEFLDFQEFL